MDRFLQQSIANIADHLATLSTNDNDSSTPSTQANDTDMETALQNCERRSRREGHFFLAEIIRELHVRSRSSFRLRRVLMSVLSGTMTAAQDRVLLEYVEGAKEAVVRAILGW